MDLKNAIHIGHSTGGGEVIRYLATYGKGFVAKAVLISSVTPIMVKTDSITISVFDEIRKGSATKRPQYFQDFILPFYGFNRPDAKISQVFSTIGVSGNDGWYQSALRLHQSIFRDRFGKKLSA